MENTAPRAANDGRYGMAIAVALVTVLFAVVCAVALGIPLRDPDGFLGPTYVRLPLIAAGLLALDVVPRALMRSGLSRSAPQEVLRVTRERWPWHRLRPVMIGLAAFYATYVGYRNLKHFLPLLRPDLVDDELRALDEVLTGGVAPAEVLHDLLGTGISAHVLSWVYVGFLIFVPASLGVALVANGRSGHASWYVTALCLNWSLGTASYYMLPSMGPVYAQPGLFTDLPETSTSQLQVSLLVSRALVVTDPQATDRVQSIAAFASLHTSIIFTAALIGHLVLTSVVARWALWVFFALTAVATIYFGWHYIADDVAGLAIGVLAVVLGGWGTGQLRRYPARAGEPAGVLDEQEVRRPVVARLRRRPQPSPSPS
jgi:hypothetical protein